MKGRERAGKAAQRRMSAVDYGECCSTDRVLSMVCIARYTAYFNCSCVLNLRGTVSVGIHSYPPTWTHVSRRNQSHPSLLQHLESNMSV